MNDPTEGDALYRAILENPDDLDHRRIYADWLEENGLDMAPVKATLESDWPGYTYFVGGHALHFSKHRPLCDYSGRLPGQCTVSFHNVGSLETAPQTHIFRSWYGMLDEVEAPHDWLCDRLGTLIAHPIRRVVVTDKRPQYISLGARAEFHVHHSNGPTVDPRCVSYGLVGDFLLPGVAILTDCPSFLTQADGIESLNKAVVANLRERAAKVMDHLCRRAEHRPHAKVA